MKRKTYEITASNGYRSTKNAWNSSIREVERAIRELAIAERATYELADQASFRDGGHDHVRGFRTWKTPAGKLVTFHIQRIE